MHIRIISVLQHGFGRIWAAKYTRDRESEDGLKILICSFYPAWDHVYSAEEMKEKLEEAEELVVGLRKAIAELDTGQDLRDLTKLVSKKMEMQMLSENPLFIQTVNAFRKELK